MARKKNREKAQRRRERRRRKKARRREQARVQREERLLSRQETKIHAEIRHIIACAQAGEVHVVSLGSLVFFSSAAGDAWMLDPGDGNATCLARAGEPQNYDVRETDGDYIIAWEAVFRLDGDSFIVAGWSFPERTVQGYPVGEIAEACQRVQPGGAWNLQEESAAEPAQPAVDGEIDWALATRGVPTTDVLEELKDGDPGSLQAALDALGSWLGGRYPPWEAIIRVEQGLTLTPEQERHLDGLMSFSDDDERMLYLDELPRPLEPWYASVRRLAPLLLLDGPMHTSEAYFQAQLEGGWILEELIDAYCEGLSLPPGAQSPLDAIPQELGHRLAVQCCLAPLNGLGQDFDEEEPLTLEDVDQRRRLVEVEENLDAYRESLEFLGLDLDGLLALVELPAVDAAILREYLLQTVFRENH